MAYTINLTNGTIFATIADGTINTQSSMILVGKNYAGYGEFLDENFIHLLENGANAVAPGAPLTGQLWWDTANSVMKVYNGTAFKVISASTASASAPTSNVAGDLWFDTVNQQLKVYNGTQFILVGPSSTSSQGTSGAIVTTITDSTSNDHVVVQFFVNNTIVGMVSKDPTFTPQVAISGFSTIGPGIQLSSTVANALFRGTVTNAQTLEGFNPSDFLSAVNNTSTSGTLGVLNDGGLSVGADSDARLSVSGSDVFFRNQTAGGNLVIQVNTGSGNTTAITINGSNGNVSIPTSLTAATIIGNISGNITATGSNTQVLFNDNGSVGANAAFTFNKTNSALTVGNVFNANGNGIGNIGSSSTYFNRVFATSTSALYADVAERFEADTYYEAGTVVELGGIKEVTKSVTELSDNVFGVVSTRAAFLMNGGAGEDETHPPIAMTGRVPVRTVGTVKKGDRLVAAGNGFARAALPGEATAFNVIGRALEDKMSTAEGMVESIVTIK